MKSKISILIRRAELFEELSTEKDNPLHTFYRAQPKDKDLFGHTSGLAFEKVPGIFAFENPETLFDTYSWLHMKKNLDNYEMIKFKGVLIDKPADSEGVVVKPQQILEKIPLEEFAKRFI